VKPNIHTDIHCLSFRISSDLLLSFLKALPFLRARLPCFTAASAQGALTKHVSSSPLSVSENESGLRSKHQWLSIFIKPCLCLECSLRLSNVPSRLQPRPSALPRHPATTPGTPASPPSPGPAEAGPSPPQPPEHRRGLPQPRPGSWLPPRRGG